MGSIRAYFTIKKVLLINIDACFLNLKEFFLPIKAKIRRITQYVLTYGCGGSYYFEPT